MFSTRVSKISQRPPTLRRTCSPSTSLSRKSGPFFLRVPWTKWTRASASPGLAGMRPGLAAQAAAADVAIISKVHPLRSHSAAAQGGINAALGEDDSCDTHAFDTVKGSDYLGDQDAIEILTGEAPGDIVDLERMGGTFPRRG